MQSTNDKIIYSGDFCRYKVTYNIKDKTQAWVRKRQIHLALAQPRFINLIKQLTSLLT
jgi:hypothetical protein